MSPRHLSACAIGVALVAAACGEREPKSGTVPDEAKRAGVSAESLVRPTDDYFHDMDVNVVDGRRPTFTTDEV